MSAEIPLSTRTLLVLNPSIMIMMTRGSSWGCFTPLASSSEKHMSWLVRLCFRGGRLCTLFTCLWYDFLRERNEPPMVGPPVIVFLSLPVLFVDEVVNGLRLFESPRASPSVRTWQNLFFSHTAAISLFV